MNIDIDASIVASEIADKFCETLVKEAEVVARILKRESIQTSDVQIAFGNLRDTGSF